MRTPTIAAAAVAALALVALTGCAPAASPEEQAVSAYKSFVEASANGGDINFCEGAEYDASDVGASKLNEGSEITAEETDDPNTYNVTATVSPVDGPEEDRASSLHVLVEEGADPCIVRMYSYVW